MEPNAEYNARNLPESLSFALKHERCSVGGSLNSVRLEVFTWETADGRAEEKWPHLLQLEDEERPAQAPETDCSKVTWTTQSE